jgi:CheY-like chemotaxis protein
MKVLIVEDDPNRMVEFHKLFKADVIHHATDAAAGIEYLEDGTEFDLVLLDHDLSDEHYGDQGCVEGTGQDVARHIAAMENPPPFVFIHSWNPIGSAAMEAILNEVGIGTFKAAFGTSDFRRGLTEYRNKYHMR